MKDIVVRQTAFVALGSNLGDSIALLGEAMQRLEALSAKPMRRSSLWSTSPVDCPPGSPPFVNAVVALEPVPGETTESLLAKLQELEREFGRRPKSVLNEPRPLDLDLIAWGSETRSTPSLILPHPRAARRQFVLRPLAEIAPELVLSGQSTTVAALLAHLETDEVIERIPNPSDVSVAGIYVHDGLIRSVLEEPALGRLTMDVELPILERDEELEPRILVFDDVYGYQVNEAVMSGRPTLLDISVVGQEGRWSWVRLDTTFGYRDILCRSVKVIGQQSLK